MRIAGRCGECHGTKEPEKGLTLTTVAGIAKGDSTGRMLVPGKPDQSTLIQAVRYTAKLKMPPDGKLALREFCIEVDFQLLGKLWRAISRTLVTADAI